MRGNPRAPLITGVSQVEVDFVIPRIGVDLPLGIDPFLLYKSRDTTLAGLHANILAAFNAGIEALGSADLARARRILKYPEVSEIGLGYSAGGKRGSGVGEFLTELVIETVRDTPPLMTRGVRHIEEMQLVSVGIGPDRVSDIAANILKAFLIDYTAAQCALWDIPLTKGVPLEHVWNAASLEWEDLYVDLPLSAYDKSPMLFVPRRIVRTLPWINYDDFLRMEFQTYLRAKKVRHRLQKGPASASGSPPPKNEVVQSARRDYERVKRYVAAKEASGAGAQPSLEYLETSPICDETTRLSAKLAALPAGRETAAEYQKTVLEILNTCFSPELIDGRLEVRTIDGTERRDIVFVNDSDHTFWDYVRNEHTGLFVMFETKNAHELASDDFNQTAVYLGDRMGRLGFVVTRDPISEAHERKAFAIYNDSSPRKVILVMSDQDLVRLLDAVCRGKNPTTLVRDKYRDFKQRVQ